MERAPFSDDMAEFHDVMAWLARAIATIATAILVMVWALVAALLWLNGVISKGLYRIESSL